MKKLLPFILVLFFSVSLFAKKPKKITIYSKPGCGRCEYVKKALNSKKVKFKELSTADAEVKRNMWKKLQADKVKGSITMPVVEVNGKLHYNMKNLDNFVTKLVK